MAIITDYVAQNTAIKLEALERKFSTTLVSNAIKTGSIRAVNTSLGTLVVLSKATRTKGETIVRNVIKSLLEKELLNSGGSILKRSTTTTHGLLENQPIWITSHGAKNLNRAKLVFIRHVKLERKAKLWLVMLERPKLSNKPPQKMRCFVLRSTPGGYHDLEAI